MLVHAGGWLLLFLVIAVLLIAVTRDKVERYPDGRPVDPTEQLREGYRMITMPGIEPPKITRWEDLPQPPKR